MSSLSSVRFGALILAMATASFAGPILPGFNATSDGRNDDGTYTAGGCSNGSNGGTCAGTRVPVGFDLNFFGVLFDSLYVNTNGNVTLDAALATFTPFGLTATSRQIIAPYFADVDTRNTASGVTTFGIGTFESRAAFGVNWINVGYFNSHVDKTNSFQLLLVDRSDTGTGNFDIVFNYDGILFETGDASGGSGGLGGSSARAGFSNGSGAAGTSYELAGSAINGALLNGGANALVSNSLNSGGVAGRYIFNARNGTITTIAPEPESVGLAAAGLLSLVVLRRRFTR